MQLSEHFSLAEMTASETAARKGIDNTPGPEVLAALKIAAKGMERVRGLLGQPIHVNSGYRSPALNRAIGGSKTSAHCLGYAVDFICPGFGSPLEVCKAINTSLIDFDQLIWEAGEWTHISFEPRLRHQVLTMRGGKYLPGLAA